MKSIRQKEANDPLNAESSSQSDEETAESKKSTTDPQPCCSKSLDALESDSGEPAIPPKARKVEKSSQSKAEKRKRSATTDKFKKLTARVDKLMSIGMQAAKVSYEIFERNRLISRSGNIFVFRESEIIR